MRHSRQGRALASTYVANVDDRTTFYYRHSPSASSPLRLRLFFPLLHRVSPLYTFVIFGHRGCVPRGRPEPQASIMMATRTFFSRSESPEAQSLEFEFGKAPDRGMQTFDRPQQKAHPPELQQVRHEHCDASGTVFSCELSLVHHLLTARSRRIKSASLANRSGQQAERKC